MDPILDVIDQALKAKGLSDAAASRQAVGHPSLIKNMRMPREGEKRYNLPALKKLADVLGLEFYFGPPRETDPLSQAFRGGVSNEVENAIRGIPSGAIIREFSGAPALLGDPFQHGSGRSDDSLSAKPEDYVHLPLHDVDLAAGAGAQNDSETVARHLQFRRDWMRKLGLSTANARLARVRGDSMIPLLSDSDLVLVDLSKTEIPVEQRRPGAPRNAHLVAIEHEGESRVKWMERPTEDSLILYSENAALYPPEVYTRADAERIRLIGRVVWWCHTVRD